MAQGRRSAGIGWRAVLKFLLFIALLIAANYLAHAVAESLNMSIRPSNEDAVHRAIMLAAAVYTLLLAVPFVPGAEIGIGMMAMLGPPIAFLVYVCTVTGITLAFLAGYLIPLGGLIRLSRQAGVSRLSDLLEAIAPMTHQQRLIFLAERAPGRILPLLLRHRYIALAVLLNLPGNFIIGGGGGIALVAGISRLYTPPGFLAVVLVAVAPVPLAVLVLGNAFLS